ncbi:thiol reductant ABC exporter subunit CydD [Dyella ginsengisoli]|uniref:thiol reductant ABC exporter subunit CydD n=1 Tax=Dyella ginsengisoli TaxID=363848 RepID=UPI0018E276AD|nr:thiol reductant ABC exporter subunit CydD [Dyella ginsengisoli]
MSAASDLPRPEVWLKSFRSRVRAPLRQATALGLVNGLLLVAQAWLAAWAINAGVMHHAPMARLWPALAALPVVFVLRFALARAAERVAFRAGAIVRRTLRADLLAHLQRLGPAWLQRQARGDLVTSVVGGVEAMEGYYARYLPTMGMTALLPLAILVAVFPADWVSALVMLVSAPLIPFFMWMIGKGTEELNQKQWRVLAFLGARFLDTLQGLTTLKLFGASRREAAVVAQVSDDYRRSTMQVLRVAFLSSVVLEFLATVSIAVVAVLVGFRLMWGELAFLPGLFALLLAPEFFGPLRNMGTVYHLRMEAIGAAERMVQIFAEPADGRPRGTAPAPSAAPSLSFEATGFAYPDGTVALDACRFTAPAGQVTAIVGASGAGKSTVLHLLLGFIGRTRGRITVGDVDLADIAETDWLARVAWVPQRAHLFEGSVADNLRLARPDADDAQLREAARAAGAEAFIDALPQGFDTPLGERGANLSGGQVQRLALARAFLKDAPVLLLDEPTAHLDTHSQRAVLEAIERLARGRTVLLVTHRLHALALADHVVVLDDGRVVEQGPPDALRAADGPFARLLAAAAVSA